MTKLRVFFGLALMSGCVAALGESGETTGSRGELLYSTYCGACHATQVHWREKKLATDWPSLMAQVRRWQGNSGLSLSEDEIAALTQYLNDLYYHFVPTDTKQTGQAEAPRRYARVGDGPRVPAWPAPRADELQSIRDPAWPGASQPAPA